MFAGTGVAAIDVTSGSTSFERSLHESASAGAAKNVESARAPSKIAGSCQCVGFVISSSRISASGASLLNVESSFIVQKCSFKPYWNWNRFRVCRGVLKSNRGFKDELVA